MSILILILFIYIIYLITDYLIWKVKYTPFIITTFPIVCVFVLNEILGSRIGFYSIIESTQFAVFIKYFSYGFTACFFSSISIGLLNITCPRQPTKYNNSIINVRRGSEIIVFGIRLIILLFFLYILFLNFIFNIPIVDIRNYLSEGWAGHFRVFLILGLVYIYGSTKKMLVIDTIFFVIAFIPIFLYGTRGWMILAIASSIFLRGMMFNRWPNIIIILFFPIISFAFVVFSYVYRNMVGGIDATILEIYYHVMGYVVAGIQGANQLFISNLDQVPYENMVFGSIKNIGIFVMGEGNFVSNVAPNFFITNTHFLNISNVSTAFGTILYGLGLIEGSVYIYFTFAIIYILFYFRFYYRNIWYLMYLSMILSGLLLSFFEYYLGLLFYVESLIYIIFLQFLHSLQKMKH